MRSLFFAILLTSISLGLMSSLAEGSSAYSEETSWRILQYDTVAVYISPVVERLSADTSAFGPQMQFRVYSAAKEGNRSLVQMQPQSEGKYSLTITFETNSTWSYTVGVYTDTASFYSEHGALSSTTSGTFVTFCTRKVEGSSGISTLVLVLDAYGKDSGSLFRFTFPKSANAVVFVAITLFLGYVNAFYMSDTFFKNKKEGISKKRWAFIVGMLVVSLLLVYQSYLLTASDSQWSV